MVFEPPDLVLLEGFSKLIKSIHINCYCKIKLSLPFYN
jgi:hypothetical protein